MYQIDLKNIEEANITGIESMYLGSLISSKLRERDFYSERISVFKDIDYSEPISKAIARAINEIYSNNDRATSERVVEYLSTRDWFKPGFTGIQGLTETISDLRRLVDFYDDRGALNIKDFRRRERIMEDAKRAKLLHPKNLNEKIAEIMAGTGNSVDKALAIKSYMDEIVGGAEFAQKTTDWENQRQILTDLPDEFSGMLNKARFTFPPHWGLNQNIPMLRPGEMCVLSGGTGDGKSSMAMMFAEWAAICGKNVLVIHMEDSDKTILMRQTVRWIGGSFLELEKGDPMNKMQQMIKLREWWNSRGGSLVYKYLAGNTYHAIIEQIKEHAASLEAQDKQLDLVVIDYFQKIDFDSAGGNYVLAANAGAEAFKIISERLRLFTFIVSQETPDSNGGKHTAWSRALEQKPQIYLSLSRHEIKKAEDEEKVSLYNEETRTSKSLTISSIGDRSCWLQLHIKKVNNGKQGTVWLFFDGTRFRSFDPEFMKQVDRKEINEFDVPVLKPADKQFWDRQREREDAYYYAYYQLKNPDEQRRERLRQQAEDKNNE